MQSDVRPTALGTLQPDKGLRDWILLCALLVLTLWLGASLAFSFAVDPADIDAGAVALSPPCSFKEITGSPCPTCGLTRAFCALSHGRFALALQYHRASPFLYALYWLFAFISLRLLGRTVRHIFRSSRGTCELQR